MEMSTIHLPENEQKLLMRFVDGECSDAEASRAQELVLASPAAASLVEELKKAGSLSRAALQAPELSPELWKRVFNRIDQEERLAVFFGRRKIGSLREHLLDPLFDGLRDLGWKMYGPAAALVAVCAVFVIALSSGSAPAPAGRNFAAKPGAAMVNAGATGENGVLQEGSYSPPILLEEEVPVSLEVDWMKSRGSVRLFQVPGARSTILSIDKKRRAAASARLAAGPVLKPDVMLNK